MKLIRVLSLSMFVLLPLFAVLPVNGQAQQEFIFTRNNSCSFSNGDMVSVGTRFHRADETNYYRCWYVLGPAAQPAGAAWIPGQLRNSEFFIATSPNPGGFCTRPGNGSYSHGAVVFFDGSVYRCTTIVGPDLKPSGLAWVEVEVRANNSFLIKGQR